RLRGRHTTGAGLLRFAPRAQWRMGTRAAARAEKHRAVPPGTIRRHYYQRRRLWFTSQALRQTVGGRSGLRRARPRMGQESRRHSRMAGANRHSATVERPARADGHLPRVLPSLPRAKNHVAAAAVVEGDSEFETG